MFEKLHELSHANHYLETAVQRGDLAEVKKQLDIGAELDYSPYDCNMLVMAAGFSHWEVVNELLDRGANIFSKNRFKMSALHFMAAGAPLNLVEKIVSLGAQCNDRNSEGDSAFALAVKANRHDVVDYFLDNVGVNITVQNKKGETTLHHCARAGVTHKDMFFKLWYQGVDISLRNEASQTSVELIQDAEWKEELAEFEKTIPVEKASKVEVAQDTNTKPENVEVVKETLKAHGISSIKRKAPTPQ